MKYAALLLLLLGCSLRARLPEGASYSLASRPLYDQVYHVRVTCTGGGAVGGSAVAVSSTQAFTAKHVLAACFKHGKRIDHITLINETGSYNAVLEDFSREWDAVRLRLADDKRFPAWSPLSSRPPRAEDVVCIVATTPLTPPMYKCGRVIKTEKGILFAGAHVVPGNSGGPIYNTQGEVVAIVSAGRWRPELEFIVLGPLTTSFAKLWP